MWSLKSVFGPSGHEEAWMQLSRELGAEYIEGGVVRGDKVLSQVGNWSITLSAKTKWITRRYESDPYYTGLSAPFVSEDGFEFAILHDVPASKFLKLLGMEDIEVGYPELDQEYVIKSNMPPKVQLLFGNGDIRDLLRAQPDVTMEAKYFTGKHRYNLPDGIYKLYLEMPQIITDITTLKNLFSLVVLTLNYLCSIGSASDKDPLSLS